MRDTTSAPSETTRDTSDSGTRSTSGTTADRSTSSRSTSGSSGFSDPNRDVRDVLRDNAKYREREFGSDPYEGRRGPGVGDPEGPIGQPGASDSSDATRATTREAGDRFDEARSTRGTTSRSTSSSGFSDPNRDVRDVLRDNAEYREREFGDDPYEGRRGPGVGDPEGPIGQPGVGNALRDAREDLRDTRDDAREDFREARDSGTSSTRDAARDFQDTFRDAREDFRDTRDDVRDDLRDTRDDVRDTRDELGDRDDSRFDSRTRTDARIDSRTGARATSQTRLSADDLGLSFDTSARGQLTIDNINSTSPLARFGFQSGDQILSVNGSRLTSQSQFFDMLTDPRFADGSLQVAVWRDGEQEILTIDPNLILPIDSDPRVTGRSMLSADDIGVRFSSARGRVTISDVARTSVLGRFGFQPGDELLTINGVRVANDRQFLQFLTNPAFSRGDLEVAVWRDGQQEVLTLDPQAFLSLRTSGRVATDFDVNSIRSADIGLWLRTNATGRGLVIADIGTGAISRFGFQEGDQILSVNGVRVADQRGFLRAVFDPDFADQPVEVAVWRDGQQEVVTVQPSLLIDDFQASMNVQTDPLESWGVVLDDRYDDYPVIWRVSPRSSAFYAGLRPGDVIVNWAGQRITSPRQLSTLIQQAEAGEDVAIQVSRNRQLRSITLDANELRTALRPSIEGTGRIDGTGAGVSDRLDRGFDRATDRSFDPTGSLPRTGTGVETDRSFNPRAPSTGTGTGTSTTPGTTIRSNPGVGVDGAGTDVDFNTSSLRPFGR